MSIFNEINYNILKNKGSIITPVYISKSEFNKLEKRPSFCESLDEMKSIDSNYIPVELKIINPYIIDYKKNMDLYESLFQNPSEEQINSLKNKGFDGLCLNMNGSKYYKVFESKQVNPIVEDIQDDPVIEHKIYQAVHDWTGSANDYAFKELQEIYKYLPQSAKEYTGMLYRGITVNREIIEGLLNGKKYAFSTQKKASSWTPKLELADRFSKTSIVLKTRITKSSQNRVFLNLDEIGYRQFDESEVILYGTGLTTNTISLKNIELINGKKVSEIIKNKEINSVLSDLDEVSKAEKYLQQLNKNSNGRFGMLVANYDWLVHSFINNDPAPRQQLKFYRLSPSQKEILLKNAKFWADKILSYPNRKAILTAFERGDLGPSYGMYDIVTQHLEESYIPLNESKVDYILQNKKASEKIAEKYCTDNKISLKEPVETIASMALKQCEKLPYTNKYMIWLMKQYVKNKFKIPEDLPKLNSELEQFSKISHKLEKTNIHDYSWDEFLSVLPKLDDIHTSKEEERIAKAGAEKLFEDENWLVIHPKTEEAACYYGKGTRWCTAAREDNYFDRYNQDGNLYIIISKKNPEEKYQIHFQSGSFMNAEDKDINDAEKKRILSDDGLQKFLLKLSKKYNNAVDDKLLNYNGEPFIVPFDTLYIVYSDKDNDSMLFDEVKYTLIDKPDYLVNNIGGEWDIILDKEDEEIILNAYKKLGIKYPEDLTKRILSEIERSFSSTQRSFSSNFDNLAQKIIDDTNLDQICEDIWIESTYKEKVQDIFYQINKQVPFNVEEYKKDTIKISAINEKQSNEIKNIILQYQIFYGEIDPDYYYYDNRQEFSDVYEYIVYTLMEGNEFSIFEPKYGWSGFDRKALTKYISDTVYDYIINNVSAEEINVINKDISDYFEEK